jgi:negative regulator of genetic competence, sporulation and motility
MNKLITRGYGGTTQNAGILTLGMGGPVQIPDDVIEKLEDVIRKTGGKLRHSDVASLQEIVVWAKLIEINNLESKVKIAGKHNLLEKNDSRYNIFVSFIVANKKKIFENVKIFIKRIFR